MGSALARLLASHAWLGGLQLYLEDDRFRVPPTVSYQNWTPGFVGTRGSGFIDPKQPAQAIRYYYDEWDKIAPEKRDAMQEYSSSTIRTGGQYREQQVAA